jgi:hypothetical protein
MTETLDIRCYWPQSAVSDLTYYLPNLDTRFG